MAISGEEAVDKVRERFKAIEEKRTPGNFKLIIMDYDLMDMTGVDASVRIFNMIRDKGLDPTNTSECPYICCYSD